MIGGGWRVRSWAAPRPGAVTLAVGVAALQVVGATPGVARDFTTAPDPALLRLSGQEVTLASGQPAVRWNGLTSRGRGIRAWGPHPTQGTTARRAQVSVVWLEVPAADATCRISYVALSVPERGTTPKLVGLHRSGLSSFIGKQVWGPSSGGYNEVARDIPTGEVRLTGLAPERVVDTSATDRTAQVSWVQLSVPNADRRARVSYVALSTPDGPTKARVSWVQLSVPDAPRRARVSYVALSVPTAPVAAERRALVSWVQLQVPQPIDITAPPSVQRTWTVPRESRTYVVPRETRSWKGR